MLGLATAQRIFYGLLVVHLPGRCTVCDGTGSQERPICLSDQLARRYSGVTGPALFWLP